MDMFPKLRKCAQSTSECSITSHDGTVSFFPYSAAWAASTVHALWKLNALERAGTSRELGTSSASVPGQVPVNTLSVEGCS